MARPSRSSSGLGPAWKGICIFAESQFEREKIIVRGIRQNERIGSRFRDDARAENRGWEVRPSSSGLNHPVFGLGFVLGNKTWLGLVTSRAAKAWRTRIWTVPKLSPILYKSFSH